MNATKPLADDMGDEAIGFYVTSEYGVRAEQIKWGNAMVAGPFRSLKKAVAVRDELWAEVQAK